LGGVLGSMYVILALNFSSIVKVNPTRVFVMYILVPSIKPVISDITLEENRSDDFVVISSAEIEAS
jgi:hypothetical protein